MKKKIKTKNPVQPVSGTKVPRFAGPSTFARLPEMRDVKSCDVAIVGIPFDAGTSYRPGARFGPQSIRQASRHLRTNYHPNYDIEPFKVQQVADAGDIVCNPFNINEAIQQIEKSAFELLNKVDGIISMGGDHTIAFPLLKAINKINNGPVALVHFDAHLDTWDTYFGAPYTHGTPFRRAREENLFLDKASMHVGIRGPLFILFIAFNNGKAIVWSPPMLIIPLTLFKSSKADFSICLIASLILNGLHVISPASATC